MNARTRRAQEEAKEAELSRKELGLEEDNLKALIQSRQKDWPKEMDNFSGSDGSKILQIFQTRREKTALKKENK